ncbi:mutanase [Penicillium expansum]|nr:mutanase [Penicillium expansum]
MACPLSTDLLTRQDVLVTRVKEPKAVFAHFMLENAKDWNLGAWEDEINLARAAHIDGFALNFGSGVTYDVAILKAVIAANKVGFKFVFLFDDAGNGPFTKDTVI